MSFQKPFATSLETERLTLVPVTVAHAQEMNAAIIASIDELKPWLPWAASAPSVQETTAFCERSVSQIEAGTDFPLVMRQRTSGELLGAVGLHRIDWDVPAFEVGYWCDSRHTGRGYVSESVQRLVHYVFQELDAARLSLHADTRNIASRAVAERLRFELEGIARNDSRDNQDQLSDTAIYARYDDLGLGPGRD
ncbi:MAG: GNAT family N-acetyltransferase [Pseudomonadaceae bacterium]|nr:GNAT family N-acetyltransferase [Pseudomonadaceae bacterium]